MTILATAHVSSTAPPAAFFQRWADMATWPEWNSDLEWARLDGPFATGSTGQLRPTGGPTVPFVIHQLEPDRAFVDVTRLWGARLIFNHQVTRAADDGVTYVDVTVTITGPLRHLWRAILGKGIAASTQPDLDQLARAAEPACQAVR